jgi:hypothetical protein
MPVTEQSALRVEPSPDLPADLAFDNVTVLSAATIGSGALAGVR